jgi:hypothetical protein
VSPSGTGEVCYTLNIQIVHTVPSNIEQGDMQITFFDPLADALVRRREMKVAGIAT